ncbi:MAG TPA: DPP IV N-terminal domain-containing protein, partial [Mucilaginibacter sp.]|nr:DPP IV N-terminal domain-containing protein [Mucilaginibacter sp.]
MKRLLTVLLIPICAATYAQKLENLTVEKIMRDPKWMGVAPSNFRWSDDSKKLYFNWNPNNTDRDELFAITPANIKPAKISIDEQRSFTTDNGEWNKNHTTKLYEKNGDLFLLDIKIGKTRRLTSTTERESSPSFNIDQSKVIFTRAENLYTLNLNNGELVQITNFTHSAANPALAAAMAQLGRRGSQGSVRGREPMLSGNEQERWLKAEQLELFDIIKVKEKDRKLDSIENKQLEQKKLREIGVGDQLVSNVKLSPDGRYVTYTLVKLAADAKRVNVPDYVTASGYTEDILNRTKVGAAKNSYESYVFDTKRDSVYRISPADIPGIRDIPAYLKDYPKELEQLTKRNEDRKVTIRAVQWSEDGKYAVAMINAQDNKDRWIMKLDAAAGKLSPLHREHNDAWVGGPGAYELGWLDDTHIYFESEDSGYAHIYV